MTRKGHWNGALLLNIEPANRWVTLLANIGVLAGLVFLALEVRQSNRIAIATTEMSVWGTYVSLNQIVLQSDGLAALLVKASDINTEFTPEENEKLSAHLYSFIDSWYSIEIAHNNGMTTDTTYSVIRSDIRNLLHYYPALRPLMRSYLNDYPNSEPLEVYSQIRRAIEESSPP